jgi:hypothetical protein
MNPLSWEVHIGIPTTAGANMKTIRWTSGIAAALLMFATAGFHGCAEDESDPPTTVAPLVDPRLHGDWAECDAEWEYQTNGIRIEANGSLFWLGIDWTTGASSVLEHPLFIRDANITARDGRLMYNQAMRAPDTLTYMLEGDRMEWRSHDVPMRRYRRITPGQKLFEPIVASITAEIDGEAFSTQHKLPYPPAWARIETRGNTFDINIACTDLWSFEFVVLGAYGPGKYTLAAQGQSWARISHIEGDMVYGGATNAQQTGSITIDTFDHVQKRITGTFGFDALSYRGDTIVVRNGIFDLPIRE